MQRNRKVMPLCHGLSPSSIATRHQCNISSPKLWLSQNEFPIVMRQFASTLWCTGMQQEVKWGQEVFLAILFPNPFMEQLSWPDSEIMSDNGRLMVLGLIELGQRSNGSEPWSLWLTHLPPAASATPLGKPKIGVTPPQSQFLQLNQNSHGTKINVTIVGAKRHVLTMANVKNSKWQGLLACWALQIWLWGGPTLFFKPVT